MEQVVPSGGTPVYGEDLKPTIRVVREGWRYFIERKFLWFWVIAGGSFEYGYDTSEKAIAAAKELLKPSMTKEVVWEA